MLSIKRFNQIVYIQRSNTILEFLWEMLDKDKTMIFYVVVYIT